MHSTQTDEYFMRRAIDLAKRAWGFTHPNPMVGAVIVEDGSIVAEGFHAKSGEAHAERNALNALGRKPKAGATLYVTLEPCSTHGRTGSCSHALIESGISRVVVGATDPNPDHAGEGFSVLRNAGIDVLTGILEKDCSDLNLIFNHWITHKTPFVAAKCASTLDGYTATASGDSKWITGEQARLDVMRWRRYFPAIAVGKGTVLADNPSLTSRLPDATVCPRRLIFDGNLELAKSASDYQVFTDEFSGNTVVVCNRHPENESYANELKSRGVSVWNLADAPWERFQERCIQEGLYGIYVEGGAHTHAQLLAGDKVHYIFSYRAPLILGDARGISAFGSVQYVSRMKEALRLENVRHEIFGDDELLRGNLIQGNQSV